MRNSCTRYSRNDDFRDDLIGTEIMLALIFVLRNHKEFFQRQFAFAFRSFQPDLCPICNENGSDGGRTDKLGGTLIAENGVVAVIAICDQFFTRLILGQEAESIAEVPAARPLAEITGQRRHVTNLRAGRFDSCLGEGRVILLNPDRKSTRLNSSHVKISYAVFCLKKKK